MDPLDNPIWHALTGPLAALGHHEPAGVPQAARFARDVSPFGALPDQPDEDAWRAMAELLDPDETVFVMRPRLPVLKPCTGKVFGAGLQLVGEDVRGEPMPDAVELTTDDVPEMLALVERTQPGPFAARTIETGRYVGVRREGRLVAMAGERMRFDGYVEVSAVCTDPEHQGRGLARALVGDVAAAISARGAVPILHVLATNEVALGLYRSMGFRDRIAIDATVVRRAA